MYQFFTSKPPELHRLPETHMPLLDKACQVPLSTADGHRWKQGCFHQLSVSVGDPRQRNRLLPFPWLCCCVRIFFFQQKASKLFRQMSSGVCRFRAMKNLVLAPDTANFTHNRCDSVKDRRSNVPNSSKVNWPRHNLLYHTLSLSTQSVNDRRCSSREDGPGAADFNKAARLELALRYVWNQVVASDITPALHGLRATE